MAEKKKPKSGKATIPPQQKEQVIAAIDLKKKVKRNVYLMIFVISFAFYGNTLWNGYSMDDDLVIRNHPLVHQGISGIPKIFASRYSINEKQSYEYRPVTLAVFAVEYQFFGEKPAVGHFINILIYAVVAVLLFEIISKIFLSYHWILPAMAVFIFLIHPIHSEVVASVKNRDELLAVLFSLLAISKVIKFSENPKQWRQLLYVFLFVFLAALSKKSAITILAIIPLVIYFITPKEKFSLVAFAKKSLLPVLAVVFAFIVIRLILLSTFGHGSAERNPLFFENPLYEGGVPFFDRLAIGAGCFWFYLQKLIVPYPLISYYGYNAYELTTWTSLTTWLGLIFGLGITVIAFRKIHSRSPWIFGWLYMLISISMFINVFGAAPGVVAERFAFSSSIGFSLIMAWVIFQLFFKTQDEKELRVQLPNQVKYIGITLLVLCGLYILNRNADWKSTGSLYLADVQRAPQSAKLNSLMGTEVSNAVLLSLRSNENKLPPSVLQQKADSAIMYFNQAINVYPDYAAVHNNVGTIHMMAKENYSKARYHFKRAVEIDSAYTQALFNLGFQYQFDQEVYESMLNSFMVISADSHAVQSNKTLSSDEIWVFGLALHKAQKTAIGHFKTALRSKSKEELAAKLANFEANLKLSVSSVFSSLSFVPSADSFGVLTSKSVQDILLNGAGGDPETVIKSAFIKHVGSQLAKHISQFKVPVESTSWLNYFERKHQVAKDSMIACYNQTLHFKPSFTQAYNQLNGFFTQKQMSDSVIALNTRMLNVSTYQPEQLEVYIANAFVLKGDTKSAIQHYEKASDLNLKLLNRIATIQQQMVKAGNQNAAMLLANWFGQKRKELKAIYQILSAKYLELGDVQKGTDYQSQASNL